MFCSRTAPGRVHVAAARRRRPVSVRCRAGGLQPGTVILRVNSEQQRAGPCGHHPPREQKTVSEILKDTDPPYLNKLSKYYALAAYYHAVTHLKPAPGITDNCQPSTQRRPSRGT